MLALPDSTGDLRCRVSLRDDADSAVDSRADRNLITKTITCGGFRQLPPVPDGKGKKKKKKKSSELTAYLILREWVIL